MPDQEREARTEEATPRRREEAREKGQVPRSNDLSSALMLLAGLVFIRFYGPVMVDEIKAVTVEILRWMGDPRGDGHDYYRQCWVLAGAFFKIIAPISLFLLALGLAVNWVQFGFIWAGEPLSPNLDKINPINGFKRLFSARAVVLLAGGLLKVAAAGLVLWLRLRADLDRMIMLPEMPLSAALTTVGAILFRAGLELVIILLAIGILDYLFQRWQFERDLRMTKQEVREEMKRMEGDPAIRARRRAIMRRMIMQHMMRRVPEADVVITNPTHLAIALKYEEGSMSAPEVVAKGERLVALRIRELAAQHGVPVIENKPLARAMYKAVEVGRQIPWEFYEAVAEVLAMVYGISARRSRRSA
ncbi:MAG TPA: flagellar biosynthesis protein FlhB [Planctomycetota bacterium]|nr:flagellar biosynthesis protein FlhB [Planctomycetota bacterium]